MREVIVTNEAPIPTAPNSQAIRYGTLLYVSGQIARSPESGEIEGEDIRTQTTRVLKNVEAVLRAGGASLATCLKVTCYLVDMGDFAAFNEVYRAFFPIDPPARTTVEVASFANGVLVEIDAVAFTVNTRDGVG